MKKVYWLRDNVLKPIYKELIQKERYAREYHPDLVTFSYKGLKNLIKWNGKTNKEIAEGILHFTHGVYTKDSNGIGTGLIKDTNPQFYAYFADYDWVVFCWLFGRMIDLPKGFPMYCIDLQQESDRIYNLEKEKYIKNGGRNFINKMSNHLDYPKQTNEHNALADARWNYELYKFLNTL